MQNNQRQQSCHNRIVLHELPYISLFLWGAWQKKKKRTGSQIPCVIHHVSEAAAAVAPCALLSDPPSAGSSTIFPFLLKNCWASQQSRRGIGLLSSFSSLSPFFPAPSPGGYYTPTPFKPWLNYLPRNLHLGKQSQLSCLASQFETS